MTSKLYAYRSVGPKRHDPNEVWCPVNATFIPLRGGKAPGSYLSRFFVDKVDLPHGWTYLGEVFFEIGIYTRE